VWSLRWDTWSGRTAGPPASWLWAAFPLPVSSSLPQAIPPPPAKLTESPHMSTWLQPKEPLLSPARPSICSECSWECAGVSPRFPSPVYSLSLSWLQHFSLRSLTHPPAHNAAPCCLWYTAVSIAVTSSSVLTSMKNLCAAVTVSRSLPKRSFCTAVIYHTSGQKQQSKTDSCYFPVIPRHGHTPRGSNHLGESCPSTRTPQQAGRGSAGRLRGSLPARGLASRLRVIARVPAGPGSSYHQSFPGWSLYKVKSVELSAVSAAVMYKMLE